VQSGPYPPPPPGPVGVPARPGPVDGAVRPSGWWYAVAAAAALTGIIVGVVVIGSGWSRYVDRIEGFTRGDVPVTLEVRIADTGGYSIYHEYPGVADQPLAPEPDVSVTDPSGAEVELDRYDSTITYDDGGHEGEGIWTFDADEPGVYEVTATGDTGTAIAVGRGLGRGVISAVVGGIVVGLGGIVVGGVLAIVLAVRRGRSRRALQPPPPFVGWGPPPPPGPGVGTRPPSPGPGAGPGWGPPSWGASPGWGPPRGSVPPDGSTPPTDSAPPLGSAPPTGSTLPTESAPPRGSTPPAGSTPPSAPHTAPRDTSPT
jgi:hypothetical protein